MEVLGKVRFVTTECQNGMCYFQMDTANKDAIKFSGKWGPVECYYVSERVYGGMTAKFTGTFDSRGIFRVTDIVPSLRYSDDLAHLMSVYIHGIGERKAKNILELLFGDQPNITAKEKKLRELDIDTAQKLIKAKYKSISLGALRGVIDFLGIRDQSARSVESVLIPYRVPCDVIASICYDWGPDAYDVLTKHPYSMIKNGLQLWVCEALAKAADISCIADERIKGLIHFAMRKSVQAGWSKVSYRKLCEVVNYYSLRYAYGCRVPEILTTNIAGYDGTFVHDDKGYSYKKLFDAERSIGHDCQYIAEKSPDFKGDKTPHIKVTAEDIAHVEKSLNVKYSPSQEKAFRLIEGPGVSILTGGPGTGKTTVVKGLIKSFKHYHEGARIALCAPSGRAAKRLSESSGMDASTIHKLLDYCPFNGVDATYKNRYSNPIQADLVIVDECSMVDAPLFSMLLGAIKAGTTVLVCGDEDQLASVGPGNVLHDLIKSGEFPCCRLTENHRQGDDGTIIENAKRVLNKQMPVNGTSFHLIRAISDKDAFRKVIDLAEKTYDDKDPFSMQIIEPAYKGDAGVDAVNKEMRSYLGRDLKRKISEGDKVMFTRTSYKNGYVNGQLGTVQAMDGKHIIIDTDGGTLELTYASLKDITPAYSFTIHKAQGSEADTVIICLPKTNRLMLQRSLLYTAITRAKKEVYIVYVDDALKVSLAQNKSHERKTRLAWLIQQWAHGVFIGTRKEREMFGRREAYGFA